MEKPQIRRKNYLISTLPNSKPSVSDEFSIYSTDSISKMDLTFTTPKNSSIQASITSMSREDSSNNYNTINISNNYNTSNLKSNSKVFFPSKIEESNYTQNHQTKSNKIRYNNINTS